MSYFRLAFLPLPILVGLALATAGCAAPPLIVGASYVADGGLLAASDKTSTDHLMSMVSKKDCAMWRVFRGRPVCTERADGHDPYDVDYTQPQRVVAEDGVQYLAPLRSGPGVPGASWDAAAYASAPPPGSPPATPQAALPAALADPAPMAPSAARPSAAPAKAAVADPTSMAPAAAMPPPAGTTAKAAVADPASMPPPAAKPTTLVKKAKAKPARKPSRGRAASGS